ncbi:hypothetical protein LZ554_009201 [Drepanopeziza brunnea f. sp. 'monogermtubi']|nr:hypothetical protein LZ554_009201 [Drepanopeziza brunnea f. sp. 'monogermtubi']
MVNETICYKCGETFRDEDGVHETFLAHFETEHPDVTRAVYECTICKACFWTKNDIRFHRRNAHGVEFLDESRMFWTYTPPYWLGKSKNDEDEDGDGDGDKNKGEEEGEGEGSEGKRDINHTGDKHNKGDIIINNKGDIKHKDGVAHMGWGKRDIINHKGHKHNKGATINKGDKFNKEDINKI